MQKLDKAFLKERSTIHDLIVRYFSKKPYGTQLVRYILEQGHVLVILDGLADGQVACVSIKEGKHTAIVERKARSSKQEGTHIKLQNIHFPIRKVQNYYLPNNIQEDIKAQRKVSLRK